VKSRRRPGFTLNLDEETTTKLAAFIATFGRKTKRQVITDALNAYIDIVVKADRVREREYLRIRAGGKPRRLLRSIGRSPKGRTGPGEDL
jgi:hypothetical protein